MPSTSTDTTDAHDITVELTDSERHALLADERRRLVLDVLAGRPTGVELEALAAEVAAREYGSDAPDAAVVERVQITLHHMHLPKMDELGVLDYDPGSRRITV